MKVSPLAVKFARSFTTDQLQFKLERSKANLLAQLGTVGEQPIRKHIATIQTAIQLRGEDNDT